MKFDPSGDVGFQLNKLLNEGLTLEDNFSGGFLEVELGLEEQEIEHDLGFTPMGFIVLAKEGEGDLWAMRLSEWNSSSLWLQSNVESLKARLYVM